VAAYVVGNARSVVTDAQADSAAMAGDADFEARIRLAVHCVEAVEHQVDQHLFEASGFGDHAQAGLLLGDIDAGSTVAPAWFDQQQRVLDRGGDGDRLWSSRFLAGKSLQLADDAPGAADQFADHLQVFADFNVATTDQQRAGVVGKGLQRRQWLVQFVTDTRRKLAEHRQLAGLDGGVAGLVEDCFGALQFGDLGGQVGGAFGDA